MHRLPTLSTIGVEGNTSASEVDSSAVIRINATDSTAIDPFAVDRESAVRGAVTETEDEPATC